MDWGRFLLGNKSPKHELLKIVFSLLFILTVSNFWAMNLQMQPVPLPTPGWEAGFFPAIPRTNTQHPGWGLQEPPKASALLSAPPVWHQPATEQALPSKLLQWQCIFLDFYTGSYPGTWIGNIVQSTKNTRNICISKTRNPKPSISNHFGLIQPSVTSFWANIHCYHSNQSKCYVFLWHVPKCNFAYHDITSGCYGNCYTTIHHRVFLPLRYFGSLFAFKCQSNKRNHQGLFSH